jgi:FkbM family methyltransferase
LEPSHANCQILRANLEKEIKANRVELLRCAIGVENGPGYFEVGDKIRFDSFKVLRNDTGSAGISDNYEHVEIKAIECLIRNLDRPLIVKMDIEGAEHNLLNYRFKWIDAADCLMVEFHVRAQERHWIDTLVKEGWVAIKYFDTWHFTKPTQTQQDL